VVERATGSAADFHGRDLPDPPARRVWVHEVSGPALVLGSTQPVDAADHEAAAAAGVDVVRRRSGGGAVLVEPGEVVWVDVVVPPGDQLWETDVGRAMHWVGRTWVAALAARGIGADVHTGGLVDTEWSRRVCFGGLGPGEVTVAGRKVVGVAQRRTRGGARFQTAALLRWEPAALLALLVMDGRERSRAASELSDRAAPLPGPGDALVDAFLAALPGASPARGALSLL